MTDELNFRIPLDDKKPAGNETLINNEAPQNAKSGSGSQAAEKKQEKKGFFHCSCLHIEFYQEFFDVDTEQIKERIKCSLDPRRNDFFTVLNGSKDLYGPFWILTTLIFVVACAGNMSAMVEAWAEAPYVSRFDFIPLASSTIYSFGIIVPVIFGILFKYLGSKEVSILNTVIIYCYSLCPLIASLIIAIIPSELVDWIVLIFGIGASTLFVFKNYEPELAKYQGGSRYCLLGFFGIAQFCLLIVFKMTFYDTVFTTTTTTPSS